MSLEKFSENFKYLRLLVFKNKIDFVEYIGFA